MTGEAQAVILALEAALSDLDLGVSTGEMARPWPAVAADMDRFNTQLRPACDYAAQGVVLPGLLCELHTLSVTDPEHRVDVLRALMDCYQMAGVLLKNPGVRGLPTLAAFRAQQIAEELDDPAWLGLAAWVRGFTVGGSWLALRWIDGITPPPAVHTRPAGRRLTRPTRQRPPRHRRRR